MLPSAIIKKWSTKNNISGSNNSAAEKKAIYEFLVKILTSTFNLASSISQNKDILPIKTLFCALSILHCARTGMAVFLTSNPKSDTTTHHNHFTALFLGPPG